MKVYVEIIEYSSTIVSIEAKDEDSAIDKAMELYDHGEIVMSGCVFDVQYEIPYGSSVVDDDGVDNSMQRF